MKMEPEELERQLNHFTGTEQWHKFNALLPNYLLTDGAKFLADNAGAYWLMDLIASYHGKLKREPFQVWKLAVKDGHGVVTCEDGNDKRLIRQKIDYTDFPLSEITLYCEESEPSYWVILLPGEH